MTSSATDPCAPQPTALMLVEEARAHILDAVTPVAETEILPLREALGRVLAEPVRSALDVPPAANSAMDGYALRAADLNDENNTTLTVAGEAFAGHPFAGQVGAGQCVRIMTGALLPAGADTVVMQEQTERDGERVRIDGKHRSGSNVRLAGEDIAAGASVLEPGKRLQAPELGLIASLGLGKVRVWRRVRVAFFSTGDELVEAGAALAPGQIYDSNRYTLYGLLQRLNVEPVDLGVIPDRREALIDAFERAAAAADVVITSGGVSVGDADYVKELLGQRGSVDFWRVRMKPGKPLAFGRLGEALFFGLPGNPVSVMATFYQFVIPAIRALQGEPPRPPLTLQVPCADPLRKSPGRTDFQRGVLGSDGQGGLVVRTTGLQGSHVLSSMSRADCFIVLPAESGDVEAGTPVEVQPFDAFF